MSLQESSPAEVPCGSARSARTGGTAVGEPIVGLSLQECSTAAGEPIVGQRSWRPAIVALALALALAGCGSPEPRFAEVTVSAAAPSATLSGSTHGVAPAIELSPGCPGYLDPSSPEHLVHLDDSTSVTITARSNRGPIAIAISGEGEVRCDSDSGSGHAPHVTIDQPGEYVVHVASLNEAADLPYELSITPTGTQTPGTIATPSGDRVAVSVTITSEPSGATVRTPEGRQLGTTPAMFALQLAPEEVGQERRFVLEMPGRQAAEVTGRMASGAVVLHASLQPGWGVPPDSGQTGTGTGTPAGPELVVSSASAQPIRDYQVARQSLDVGSECTIERATVDVDIRHSFVADLRVVLRSPQGTAITLHDHGGGGRANLVTSFSWDARRGALHPLAGQSARGRWEMAVHDDAGADTGTFRSFTLRLACREGTVASATSAAVIPEAGAAPPTTVTPEPTPRTQTPRTPRIRRPQPRSPDVVSPWQTPQVRPHPLPQPQPQPQVGRRNPPSTGALDPFAP